MFPSNVVAFYSRNNAVFYDIFASFWWDSCDNIDVSGNCSLHCMIVILVQFQWVVQGAVDVDIGANPSAEGGGEDEGVDDQAVKVVDIVDTFRLQVSYALHVCWL